jgi:hypothetical protein
MLARYVAPSLLFARLFFLPPPPVAGCGDVWQYQTSTLYHSRKIYIVIPYRGNVIVGISCKILVCKEKKNYEIMLV